MVIGDHPCCQDALPLSLDWSFEEINIDVANNNIPERLTKYMPPKRLSYLERKLLKHVGGLSEEALHQRESLHLEFFMYENFWKEINSGEEGHILGSI